MAMSWDGWQLSSSATESHASITINIKQSPGMSALGYRQQHPMVAMYPHSPLSPCILRLSEKVIDSRNPIPEEGDRPFYWKNVLEMK